jgi:hypothetical protein
MVIALISRSRIKIAKRIAPTEKGPARAKQSHTKTSCMLATA